jgi:hypothetical protein
VLSSPCAVGNTGVTKVTATLEGATGSTEVDPSDGRQQTEIGGRAAADVSGPAGGSNQPSTTAPGDRQPDPRFRLRYNYPIQSPFYRNVVGRSCRANDRAHDSEKSLLAMFAGQAGNRGGSRRASAPRQR